MKKTIPAVSIVIPMYNAEKYIGECLDSILAQTFTNYEVIVVDDCSTDNSRTVVQSYLPKFTRGGELNLICLEKNSGNPAQPRNIGVRLAHGEFITFIDSDDAITPTALEELYKITVDFNVDIICCRRQYKIPPEVFTTNLKIIAPYIEDSPNFVKKITFETNDFLVRIKNFADRRYFSGSYNYLFRRELILRNNVKFPDLKMGEDRIFNFYAVCLAKNIVFAPNCFYLYRLTPNSACRANLSVEGRLHRWGKTVIQAVGLLDKFMNNFELLRNNFEYKYYVYESFMSHYMPLDIYAQVPAWQLDPLIRRELDEVQDKTALTAFLFSRMNLMNINLIRQNQIIQQLQSQLAAK